MSYTFTGLTPLINVVLVNNKVTSKQNAVAQAQVVRSGQVDKYGRIYFDKLEDSVYSLIVTDPGHVDESIYNVVIGDNRKITKGDLPFIYVSEYGIDGTFGTSDYSIMNTIFAEHPNASIVVDKPVNISSNFTIPSGVSLDFTRDGYFYITSGNKIVFERGSIFADTESKIFDFESDIKVEGQINHSYWRTEWFGVYPEDTSANFARVINEMFAHTRASSVGWYPKAFRFRHGKTYYTTDPVNYTCVQENTEYFTGDYTVGTSGLSVTSTSGWNNTGLFIVLTDTNRWSSCTYTGITATSFEGVTWGGPYTGPRAIGNIVSGMTFHKRTSWMNDFVMESDGYGSRWGGAVLKSAIPDSSGVANQSGGKVIDAGHLTNGFLTTRNTFRGLQFYGHGTAGQLQNEYIVDASCLDLMHIDNCGFFYCNRGLYARDGSAGAMIVTNSYFVNSVSYNTYVINGMGNCKFDTCIIENSRLTVAGNSTDPLTFTNCHIEKTNINVEDNRIFFDGSNGTTNSTSITLNPGVCHSYVTAREVGSYIHDHGHGNTIDAGYRYDECKGITSNVVHMAYPTSRQNGGFILNSGVEWLLSVGISKDGATDEGYTDYDYKLYDLSTTDNYGVTTSGEVFKDYGTIEVGTNVSRFIPVWYEQHWDVVLPSGNIMLQPSHASNVRATRPINRGAQLRYSNVTQDGTKNNIPGWYAGAGIYTTTSGIGTYMTSGIDDKIRIVTLCSGSTDTTPGIFITLNYSQNLKLESGKTYVAIMKGTKNDGTKIPQLTVSNTPTYSNQEYQAITPTLIPGTENEYQAITRFRARNNSTTNISFGHDTTPGVMDFTFDFIAIAELGEYTKYISQGIPECGVFYNGDIIYEEKPDDAQASMYICRSSDVTSDYYGTKDIGRACSKGTWVASGEYTKGDWWDYNGRVFCARYSHSGLSELPSYSGTLTWKAIERVDAEYTAPSYLAVPVGSDSFTTVGVNSGGTSSGVADVGQYTLVDGTRPFTGTISGITPTDDAHLATKSYVDGRIAVCVTDSAFGADPTGTVDSADAIQAAIDYVIAQGGGIVNLNEGSLYATYLVSRTIRVNNDVTIQGIGHFKSRIQAMPEFYTNSGVYWGDSPGPLDNILDPDGYPAVIAASGGGQSIAHPLASHAQFKDFAIYPLKYGAGGYVTTDGIVYSGCGLYGKFFELDLDNVSSHGFKRCFHIGINNGSIHGPGLSYYGEIGFKIFDCIGLTMEGYSLVHHNIGIDINTCFDGSFHIHQESSSLAYRVGPLVYNTHILGGSFFNISNAPVLIHPDAKVFVDGYPTYYSNFAHNIAGPMHQADVYPKMEDDYGLINYVPDGDMLENTLTPTYWHYSGGSSGATLLKRRSLNKYTGTEESVHNYSGKPRLSCYPGDTVSGQQTFEVYSDPIQSLGFLDLRFDCSANTKVRVRVTDDGNSDAELYDSGYIAGNHTANHGRPTGEKVVAGDLKDLQYTATGPYRIRLTTKQALDDGGASLTTITEDILADQSAIYLASTSNLENEGEIIAIDNSGQWLTIAYTTKVNSTTISGCIWTGYSGTVTPDYLVSGTAIYEPRIGFMLSRANIYKSATSLNIDQYGYSTTASGIQPQDSDIIYTYTDTDDFPSSGNLMVNNQANQWLTINYTSKDTYSFSGCTWNRRLSNAAVTSGIANSGTIWGYYDDAEDSHQGFAARDFNSGPPGGDGQAVRLIAGTSLYKDVPHRFAGWVKSLDNPSSPNTNTNGTLFVYDNTPSSSNKHNQFWFPSSGLRCDDYEDGWTFMDMLTSTSYYVYLEKRTADIRMAGVGLLKPIEKYKDRFVFDTTPTEGWWRKGDEVLVNGIVYYCASGGDPGEWAAMSASGGAGVSDHGALTGLADDDHTQYHNDTRGDLRYFTQAAHIDAFTGSKNEPIITDKAGYIDDSFLQASAITQYNANLDHGTLGGLTDDDHTMYSKADGTRAFTGTVSIAPSSSGVLRITSTTLDQASSANLDLMEGSNSFGAAGSYGFRIGYNGSSNKLEIRSHDNVSEALNFTMDRYTGKAQFFAAVSGIAPTLDSHFTRKDYVDIAVTTLSGQALFADGSAPLTGDLNAGAEVIYFTEYDNASSTADSNIKWDLYGHKQRLVLDNSPTITFTDPPGACNLLLKLVQDGSGSHTVTWPAGILWVGAAAPTLTSTASAVDIISFYFDGTNYYGACGLNFGTA